MFENLISQLAQQFGLGDQAGPLLTQVLGTMTQSSEGGLGGFLQKFTQAGLGDQVASWVGQGENQPLSENDLTQVLGNPMVQQLAEKAGIPVDSALPAIAALVPGITDKLTPDGEVPAGLPPAVSQYLPAIAGVAGAAGLGSALGTVAPALAQAGINLPGGATASGPQWDNNRKGALGASLAGVILSGVLGSLLAPSPTPAPAPVSETPTQMTTPLPDNAPPADPAPEASPAMGANPFDGLVAESKKKAKDALGALKPGAYTGEDLTKALNILIIHFDTGSAVIPAEDQEILKDAAEAMKTLPPDTAIEVGGHTDTTGDAAANQTLSQQRAESVVKALVDNGVDPAMLQAKGYGGEEPVAPNDTEEGRFQNRRIEFLLIKPATP